MIERDVINFVVNVAPAKTIEQKDAMIVDQVLVVDPTQMIGLKGIKSLKCLPFSKVFFLKESISW